MYTIQLRNLPEDIYEAIKISASASRRSMTQEAIALIEEALKDKKLKQEYQVKKIKAIEKLKKLQREHPLGDVEDALKWIKKDRDR